MRFKGLHHIELSVLDYDASVAFFDKLFGWLGYKSFWTLDIGYRSTYYMARFPFFHSYIGIQPAQSGGKLDHSERATGIHHVALWARSRREVDAFYRDFLLKNQIPVTEPPAEYPTYTPGYYAVFFDDPITGIHFELSHTPMLPSLSSYRAWLDTLKGIWRKHPEWQAAPWKEAMRKLPAKDEQ
ncbi:VOC family protein [Gallaecimonas kandeliae]|uniref:VOC family protein n=1 Tax=Gallaecimonas kandeliae TaxID=3029055 RepID=UPI0026479EFE|nr:VOC family protein [Gallaecimonas kandeliae]WKE64573.1 VOC family protein [Gallaecimonas kandeliae]